MTTKKVFGFNLELEDDARLERIRSAFGWTRSNAVAQLIRSATILSAPHLKVELEELGRETFGLQN